MSRGDFDVTSIAGDYRVQKAGRRRDKTYGTFSRAEAAALRLCEDNPGDSFVVTREVACVCRR